MRKMGRKRKFTTMNRYKSNFNTYFEKYCATVVSSCFFAWQDDTVSVDDPPCITKFTAYLEIDLIFT